MSTWDSWWSLWKHDWVWCNVDEGLWKSDHHLLPGSPSASLYVGCWECRKWTGHVMLTDLTLDQTSPQCLLVTYSRLQQKRIKISCCPKGISKGRDQCSSKTFYQTKYFCDASYNIWQTAVKQIDTEVKKHSDKESTFHWIFSSFADIIRIWNASKC